MESTEILRDWFQRSGVQVPFNTFNGSLPSSGVSIVRWKSESADAQILTQQYCDALIFWRIAGYFPSTPLPIAFIGSRFIHL